MTMLLRALEIAAFLALPLRTLLPQIAAGDSLSRALDSVVAPEFAPAGAGGVVLVAHRDRVVFRKAYGYADRALLVPMRPDHAFLVGSITKEFTGVAILRLVAEGRVSLAEDVRTYVPSFNTHGRRITVEQVLTHTAGIPNIVDLPGFDSIAKHPHSVQQLLDATRTVPLSFEPGMSFRYSDSGYFLLGAIIEKVTGKAYGEYVESAIARPAGMTRTAYADGVRVIPGMASGYEIRNGVVTNAPFMDMTVPYAAGSMASTVDDLFLWHRALRDGKVLPKQLIDRAWEGRTLPNGVHSGYGYGFKACRIADRRSVSHGGFVNGFGAQALMLRDDAVDVIVLVNNQSDVPDAGRLARRIARFVVTGEQLPRYHTLSADERRRLAGRYEIAAGDVRTVIDSGGHVFMRRNQGNVVPLVALTPTSLTVSASEGDYTIHFVMGPDGIVSRMETKLGCEPIGVAPRMP
jgi:CubicO group peptidase (beta-lactamase class C family)